MASDKIQSESRAKGGHPVNYSASVHSRASLGRAQNFSPSAQKPDHQKAQNIQRHPTQHSITLNRKSVKKGIIVPKPLLKRSHDIVPHLATSIPVNSRVRLSSAQIDPGRAKRAHDILRSSTIERFTKSANFSAGQIKAPNNVVRVIDIKPLKRPETAGLAEAEPQAQPADSVEQAAHSSQFDKLVNNTEEEKQHRYLEYTPVKKRRGLSRFSTRGRRWLAFGAASLAIVLLSGFAFVSNKNNIELKLADIHAGINATIPDYTPTSFAISGFKYEPGLVDINYNSKQDGHGFSIKQSFSDLDSASLATLLSARWKSYDTLSSAGRTIFNRTDGESINATWVSNGLQYQITGNASLSQQQIKRIAAST